MRQSTKQSSQPRLTWIEVAPLPIHKAPSDPRLNQKNRIVQTTPLEKVEKPAPDSYLGLQNQIADRQTVSKNKTTEIGSGHQPQASPQNSKTEKNEKASVQVQADRSNPSVEQLSQQSPHSLAKTPVALHKLGVPILAPAGERKQDAPQWANTGSQPEDYVEGIAESDRTALNTREFLFFGYFQRIRERLDRAWVPILRQKLIGYYRTGRHLAHSMNHTTKVLVILNDRGEITRVQMVSESGTHDLDEAAIGAFNKAGPFPNPPKGIIDRNREIRIPWDFVLKT